MSIESWKLEAGLPYVGGFVPAPTNAEWRKITLHSLNKWKALRPDVLLRHGLSKGGITLFDGGEEGLRIGSRNCSLCVTCTSVVCPDCWRCPLQETLGRSCDEGARAPWDVWAAHGDPEPMIAALTKTLKGLEDAA